MITEREISEEIARLEASAVSFENCHRLATLYTIRDHIEAQKAASSARREQNERPKSGAVEASSDKSVVYAAQANSEFLQAVQGKDLNRVFVTLDELMGTIKIINPRLYDGVLRRLEK